MPGPLSMIVMTAWRPCGATVTRMRPWAGEYLIALCSRLRVSSAVPTRGRAPGRSWHEPELTSLRSATSGATSRATALTISSQAWTTMAPGCRAKLLRTFARGEHLVGELRGPFNGLSDLSSAARDPPAAARRLDLGLEHGQRVRNWWEASRTNRFWCASNWSSLAITWFVASTSGLQPAWRIRCLQRGQVGLAPLSQMFAELPVGRAHHDDDDARDHQQTACRHKVSVWIRAPGCDATQGFGDLIVAIPWAPGSGDGLEQHSHAQWFGPKPVIVEVHQCGVGAVGRERPAPWRQVCKAGNHLAGEAADLVEHAAVAVRPKASSAE